MNSWRLPAIVMLVVWLSTLLPLPSVLLEFQARLPTLLGKQTIASCLSSIGWQQARLYGSLFLFPIFFGLVCCSALVLPLTTVLALIRTNIRIGIFFFCVFGVGAIATIIAELAGSSAALFEIAPGQLTTNAPEIVRQAIEGFCAPPISSRLDFAAYQEALTIMRSTEGSVTRWFYVIGVIGQAIMHFGLFATVAVFLVAGRDTIRLSAPVLKNAVTPVFGVALIFGSVWWPVASLSSPTSGSTSTASPRDLPWYCRSSSGCC